MPLKPSIAVSHLGCEKNRIDSEHMLGLLAQAGYSVTGVDLSQDKVDSINRGECPFDEAGMPELIEKVVSQGYLKGISHAVSMYLLGELILLVFYLVANSIKNMPFLMLKNNHH